MKLRKQKLFELTRLSLFALAVAFVFSAVRNDAAAQEAAAQDGDWEMIAPFVNSQTAFVVRLDLASLDLDKTSVSLKRVFNYFLESAGFDEESNERCKAAHDETVDSAIGLLKALSTGFLEGASLPKIYVVGVMVDDELNIVGFLSIKDKSDAEREKLRKLASKFEIELYESNSYFVFAPYLNDEERFHLLGGLRSEPNPAMQKFFSAPSTTIDAYVARFPLEKLLIKNGVDVGTMFASVEEQKIPLRALWDACKGAFESAEFSFDLNELESSAVVTFTEEEAASVVRKELESLIDAITIEPNKAAAKKNGRYAPFRFAPAANRFGLSKLSLELTRATAREAFLPRVEGNRLVGSSSDSQGAFFAYMGAAVGFMLPSVFTANEASKRTQCTNNLKQIVLAAHNYHDVYDGFPPASTVDADGKPMHSWRVYLLPFLEQTELYRKIRLNEPWDSEWNSQFHSQVPDVYRCPADKDAPEGTTRYSFVVGKQTPFENPIVVDEKGAVSKKDLRRLATITDGTSNTICVVERKKAVCWMNPTDEFNIESLEKGFDQSQDDCLSSLHKAHKDGRGANVGMFDGSCRFITDTLPLKLFKAFGTANGGESVTSF